MLLLSTTTVPGVLLTYNSNGPYYEGSVTTVPSDVPEGNIYWYNNYATNWNGYGHNVSIYTGTSPTQGFNVTWSFTFNPTIVTYLMTSPTIAPYIGVFTGTVNTVTLTSNIYFKATEGMIQLFNYPNLPWATSPDQENDGKHVTFKVNNSYIKSNTYKSSNSTPVTVEVIVYIGAYPYNNSYNAPNNYKIYHNPITVNFQNVTYYCDVSYIS
jgi:hypothetical protein